ncbi:MAG: ribonuclease Z [Clostridia bacterium]|nr:ribonuclease Z [Clostridia bacterium]
MKITFLGSGHGVPQPGRRCTSMMVEVGERVYLIDGGTAVADILINRWNSVMDKSAFTPIKAVFTTHKHSDHTFGLIELLCLATWYHTESSWVTHLTDERLKNAIVEVIEASFSNNAYDHERMPIKVVGGGYVYEDEAVRVTYIPVKHTEDSCAILLEAEGKRVLFCGDLSGGLKHDDFPKVAMEEETDLVICEMAHFDAEQIRPYMERCKTKQWYFNHASERKAGEGFCIIREMGNRFGYPVFLARDNDEIVL